MKYRTREEIMKSVFALVLVMITAIAALKFSFGSKKSGMSSVTRTFSTIAETVDSTIKGSDIVVFSKTYCPYCKRAKEAIGALGVKYTALELDEIKDGAAIQASLLEKTGQRTVPNIFVKGTHVGGCDKTLEAIQSGAFQKLLQG